MMTLSSGIASVLLTVVLGQMPPGAQTNAAQQKADALFQAQQWGEAAAAYETVLKDNPDSSQAHLRLAIALVNLKRDRDAVPHLRKAEELGAPLPQVALRLTAIHAREGNKDAAFAELKRAVDSGLTAIPPQLADDPAFGRLRADPRYTEMTTAIDRNAKPCEHDPKYREFDFWLGEWDVRPANAPPNSPLGSNVITKIHGGCVVLESWTAPGMTGQSFNIYDRSRGQWHQTWVDSTGGLHEYWGELKDGNMVFSGDLPPLPGQSTRRKTRLTFTRLGPDSLRQHSESTPDGGKTWVTNYDLIYSRRR